MKPIPMDTTHWMMVSLAVLANDPANSTSKNCPTSVKASTPRKTGFVKNRVNTFSSVWTISKEEGREGREGKGARSGRSGRGEKVPFPSFLELISLKSWHMTKVLNRKVLRERVQTSLPCLPGSLMNGMNSILYSIISNIAS